jgi:hypothetical protein
MMEGAFFVSKGVILDWMNELLDVSKFYWILFRNSSNLQKLNNAQQEQFTAKSWTQSIQAPSIFQKSNGVLSLITNSSKTIRSYKVHSIKMESKDT